MEAAATSLLRPRPSRILPFLLASVVGHGVLIALALLLSWLLAGPQVDLDQKPIKASLVRLGKPRDEKLLPRKEDLPPPPPPEVKAVDVKAPTPDKVVKLPSKDAKPEPKVDARKSLFDAFSKSTKTVKPEELEGALDGDPNGDSAKQEGERYFGLLNSVVKRNYDVSNTIAEAERRTLRAEVAIRIGNGGELLDVRLTKSSGNDLFDSAVLGAVKKAAPYSAPPPHLRDSLKQQGVAFVFTP